LIAINQHKIHNQKRDYFLIFNRGKMSLQKLMISLLVFAAGEAGLQGQFAQTNSFDGVNLSIPDGDLDGVQDVRSVVSNISQITSVRVRLNISGDFNGDLYVYLRHNDGNSSHICVLLNRPGRTSTNNYGYSDYGLGVLFDDTAANDIHTYQQVTIPPAGAPLTGTWQPDARFEDPLIVTPDFPRSAFLDEFAGMSAGGEWTLFLADVDEGGTNFLNSWGIEITGTVAPSITWTNPAAIIYGTALGPDQLNASANVPGTFVYNPPAGTLMTVGNNQPLSVTFLPDDTNNYSMTSDGALLTVLPEPLTVSADGQFRVYGATNPPLTGTLTGVQNGDPITAVFQTAADTNSPVGAYPITPTLQDPNGKLGNYVVSYVTGTLGVGPALLGVTAVNRSRIYGATNPVFTAIYSGFVNGESLASSDVAGAPLLDNSADSNSPVGTYDITIGLGSLTSTNYTFTLTNGTLTVATAALTVTADNQSRLYGATNPPLTASYSGFINGDTAAVITGQPLITVGADTNSPAGSYPITVDTGTLIATTNYAFIFVNGSLTVLPAPLTVSADIQSRPYGSTNPVFTVTYSGFANGESLTESDVTGAPLLGTLADTTSPVGIYDITNSLGSLTSSNYTFSFTNGTLTVTAAALTVTADNQSRSYGATNPPLTGTLTGVQNGDPVTAVFQAEADTNSPVGDYPITPSLQDLVGVLGNYSVSYADGILSVTQAASEIALATSANPVLPGLPVTFSANVAAVAPGGDTPSGSVQFIVDGADYQTPVILTGGFASVTTTTLLLGQHTVSAEYSGDANYLGTTAILGPAQVIDTLPVAGADVIYRLPNLSAMAPVSELLVDDSAADGNPMIFDSVNAASGAGGTLSNSGGWVFYNPPAGFTNDDSFTYVASDDLGEYATGTVAVVVLANRIPQGTLNLQSLGNGGFEVVLYGIPWANYTIQFSDRLTPPNWQTIISKTADFQGILKLDDTVSNGAQMRFYRAIYNTNGPGDLPPAFLAHNSSQPPPFSLASVTSSANPALPGLPITFSASVAALAPVADLPSGSVQFNVDGVAYGEPVALAGGSASLTTANLPAGNHSVSAVYSGDGSVMFLNQLVNTPPVAGGDIVQINPLSAGIKFPLANLDYYDADGDPLVCNVSTRSAEGGAISVAQSWVFYTPPAGYSGADSFSYSVQDMFGATASATVEINPGVGIGDDQSANLSVVNLSNDTYLVTFSGIPWLAYTIQYTESLTEPDWHSITTMTADSQGFFKYVDTLPQGTPSRYYRSVSQSPAATASPFRLAAWTNFIAHTNGQTTMNMWSERILPVGWPNTPPVLTWDTNCLLYGLDGFTGISQCNEFQGAPGQVPVTLLTRRHGYFRGHGSGPNGLQTNRAGQRVWFCAADNTVVQMTVAAIYVRDQAGSTSNYDYSIVEFTQDVPASIQPVSVISPANMQIFYSDTPDLPYLFFATEQLGHCEANVPPFIYDIRKGGDSGSPNMIPSPDNKLVMFTGTGTTGFNAQMQADMDTLSTYAGINPANYQLHWYDLSLWAP
jgi:subtilisin-like proprotein convertase family protein